MSNFDDDDLEDYNNYSEGEEFNEDKLDDQEYDKLYHVLPKLKEMMKSYNDEIPDIDLKEALYYNYFEIEASIKELKSKFPKKRIEDKVCQKTSSKNMQLTRCSKLARLAEGRSKEPLESLSIKATGSNSKLSALARARASLSKKDDSSTTKVNKSLDILDKLRLSDSSASEKKGTSLSKLLSQKKTVGETANKLTKVHIQANKSDMELVAPETLQSKDEKQETIEKSKNGIPQVSLNIVLDDSNLLKLPNNSISLFLFDTKRKIHDLTEQQIIDNRNKRIRYSNDLFQPLTNLELDIETLTKVKQNFNEPSPDDKILTAQKNAFETSLGNLKISGEEQTKVTTSADLKFERQPPKKTKPFQKIDLAQELSTNKNYLKQHKSFVVIGHVDAGKSTLMGRLLFDLGAVDAKTVNKLVRESEKIGKGSFALAWIMDQTTEERSRGVTVDICATDFETANSRFTAIDAPGHKDFVPQMISGVSQADFALVVVDSITGEFEAGFTMHGQTKEHTLLAKNLGIEKICVVINKMDKEDWSEKRFKDIKFQLNEFLTSEEVGFKSNQIDFIPISGLSGTNVVKNDRSIANFNWYWGPTLIDYLETVEISYQSLNEDSITKLTNEDFNLSINDIFEVSHSEFGISGKVSSGLIQPGETIVISPCKEYLQIQSLKINNQPVNVAISGEIVSMTFKMIQLTNKTIDELSIGDLISRLESPIKAVKSFTCSIHLFNMDKPLLVGSPFILFRNNSHVPARISKIIEITGTKKKKKMHLVSGQNAIVEIEIQGDRLLPITRFNENKFLGRVVIRREGITIGAGIVKDI